MTTIAERYHDISVGHRVFGQGGKCEHLHGHNYRIHFAVKGEVQDVDDVGRVLDFSVIKERLCLWLEEHWDHKFLVWEQDPWCAHLARIDATVVWTTFNPTAENMAEYLCLVVGPQQLAGTGTVLVMVRVEETRKCSATYTLEEQF